MIRVGVCLRACTSSSRHRWSITSKLSSRNKRSPALCCRVLSSSSAAPLAAAALQVESLPSRPWRVLFFGTDNFSLASLKRLHENKTDAGIGHIEVVTTPDQTNAKRKRDGAAHVIKEYCLEQGIKVHESPARPKKGRVSSGNGSISNGSIDNSSTTTTTTTTTTKISNKVFRPPAEDWRVPLDGFDLGVVISFGLFLPKEIIQSFSAGCVNVHPSMLPRFRGAAPIQHTLLMDEKETGVSVICVHPTKFDCGDILAQERTNVLPQENYDMLLPRLADLGASVLLRTVTEFESAWVNRSAQQRSSNDPRAPVVPSSSSVIDWNKHSASQVFNMWRAFGTKPGVRTVFKGKVVRLLQMTKPSAGSSGDNSNGSISSSESISIDERDAISSRQPHEHTEHVPGSILLASRESVRARARGGLLVVCQDRQIIEVTSLQFENKKEVQAADFYNGHLAKMPIDKWIFA